MHLFTKCLIIVLICLSKMAIADSRKEFEPVVQIFSGISYADHDMIKEATTEDFLLLEVGEVWDMDYLLSLIKPSSNIRKNQFSIISTQNFGDVELINYWNKAVITGDGKETILAWLESVVVVQTPDGWKLKQMHSTRIDPENLPGDIKLKEMMIERQE